MNNLKNLSLGNVIKVIKETSYNPNVSQTEIFCSIFGINDINSTTVNNYCIGIRAIGLEYKKIFEDKYNNNELQQNILSIISVLENKINNDAKLIEKSILLSKVITKLLDIAQNDEHIENISKFKKETTLNTGDWALVTAKIKVEHHPMRSILLKLHHNNRFGTFLSDFQWG